MPLVAVAQPAPGPTDQLAPERVEATIPGQTVHGGVGALPPTLACQLAPERVESPSSRPKLAALAPERFGLQVTLDQESHDLLQHARALMSHQNPTGEIAPVLKRALQLLVAQLEKQKLAASACPRSQPGERAAENGAAAAADTGRHIPAEGKRAAWERDGGRCTYVSDSGRRCPARSMLELDHQVPVARGGQATVENTRLRCRPHNQYSAERTFGAEFMSRKREARRAAGRVKQHAP